MKVYLLKDNEVVRSKGDLKVGDKIEYTSIVQLEVDDHCVKRVLTLEEMVNETNASLPLETVKKVEPKINWVEPKAGERYFYVDGLGNIHSFRYRKDEIDNKILKNNKVYHTEEETELASEKQQAKVKILKRIAELNEGWWPNWETDTELKYDVTIRRLVALSVSRSWSEQNKGSEWYLKSSELAQQLINELEDELRLWFS